MMVVGLRIDCDDGVAETVRLPLEAERQVSAV